MSKYKFTFTNILFWVGIVSAVLIFENISFFNGASDNPLMQQGLSDSLFFLLFSISAISFISMLIFDGFLNRLRFNYIVLGLILLFMAGSILGVYTFDRMSFSHPDVPDYVVDNWDKIKHALAIFIYAMLIISIFIHYNVLHPTFKRMRYIYFAVVLAVVGFCLYSVIAEFDKYSKLFNGETLHNIAVGADIRSIFQNSNMFAGMILMGIASCIALNYYKKNIFIYLALVFFVIIEVFTCSLTCIVISISTLFLYLLFETIMSFKKSKTSGFVKLTILLAVSTGLALFFIFGIMFEIPYFSPFFKALQKELTESDFSNFTRRLYLWEKIWPAMENDPFHALFGFGFRNSGRIAGGLSYYTHWRISISCHSAYMQILLDSGIMGIVIYGLFTLYYFYCLIRLLKKHTRFVLLHLLIGAAYFGLGFTESFMAFLPSAQGILIGALFFLPVINKYHHLKHKEVVESTIYKTAPLKLLKPEFMVRAATRFILALLTVTVSLFVIDVYREEVAIKYLLLNITSILGMYLIFFPYLNGLFAKGGSVGKYILHLLMYALVNEIVVTPFVLSYIFLKPLLFIGFEWLIPASLCFVNLLYVAIYSGTMRGSFKLYLNTFIGFKTSLGSLIGISGFVVALQASQVYLDMYFFVTIILVIISGLLVYFVFTFLTPFKDTRAIMKYISSYDLDIMKKEVIRDQLGVYRNAY